MSEQNTPAGAVPAQPEADVMRRELLSALAMAVRRLQTLAPDSHALKVAEGIWRKYAKGTDILRSPASAPAATAAVTDVLKRLIEAAEADHHLDEDGCHHGECGQKYTRGCKVRGSCPECAELDAALEQARALLPSATTGGDANE